MRFNSLVSKLTASTLLICGLAAASNANAVVQLGFILDESGSIDHRNYAIIKSGLANAINTLVPVDGRYEISVVSFAFSAQTLVNHVLIDSVASRTAVANAILADAYANGTTAMHLGFTAMSSALTGSRQTIESTYVNFATDGAPDRADLAIAARNALIANAGVDNISVEGIGSGIDKNWLTTNICYPGPCDDTSPYNFPTQGFYIGVADAQGYADAIGNKIRVVTNQTTEIPEPGTLALVGFGLTGLFARRYRRSAAA